jgi:hypothetical protein
MQREGYLLIDHRASPGIPEEVALQIGLDPRLVKEGRTLEAATMTCAHCKSTVMKNPWRTRERASCMKCGGKYICDNCALEARLSDYDHTPFVKKVDAAKDAEAKGLAFVMQPPKTLILP